MREKIVYTYNPGGEADGVVGYTTDEEFVSRGVCHEEHACPTADFYQREGYFCLFLPFPDIRHPSEIEHTRSEGRVIQFLISGE